jgi:hypothetical protein
MQNENVGFSPESAFRDASVTGLGFEDQPLVSDG